MRTAKNNTNTLRPHLAITASIIIVALVIAAVPGQTQAGPSRVVVSRDANTYVHVWTDNTWDVYPSYDDVVISVRAARDCYATIFVVDTDGYVHVVRPYSRYDDAWVEAGVTYRYPGYEIGLGALGGRGIAYIFAVGSPYPFDYSYYGDAIFVGRFGFRIFGDPFVACRQFYVSLLPARCNWNHIGVGFARFYVREWVRYPRYLCLGHHRGSVHVRAGNYCRHCSHVYDRYRAHANDPYQVIKPRSHTRYKTASAEQTGIKRVPQKYKSKVNARSVRKTHNKMTRQVKTNRAKIVSSKRTSRTKVVKGNTKTGRKVVAKTQRSTTSKRAKGISKNKSSKSSGKTRAARRSTVKGR